jgi:FlaA1/EpsC-like NDP-sugar epimerase
MDYANKQSNIKVCLVRYGNVLESTGSVIPFFKNLLNNKAKSLPITDPKMTRFLLTLEQATDLIEWAYNHPNSHGKIAIPKIKSFSIVNIAKSLIKSYNLEGMVDLEVVGIRPGEKIHEDMISSEEWLKTEDGENYLINQDYKYFSPGEPSPSCVAPKDSYSYSSGNSVMDYKETFDFLEKYNII